jgi:hypothetical protein
LYCQHTRASCTLLFDVGRCEINKGLLMKVQQILYSVCVIALALPMLANAEIYKWKDKDGVMRYSDTPPPASIKADRLGKKSTTKPLPAEGAEVGLGEASQPAPVAAEVSKPKLPGDMKDPPPDPKLEAARLRAQEAEIEKQKNIEKEKQAKVDAENCKSAKANYQTYSQGGRIYKINEKGERVFEDAAGLAAGKAKAQAEMQQYCN